MKSKELVLIPVALALYANGCSTASVRVMPGDNGENRIVSRDITKEGAEEAAIKQANKFCERQKRVAYFKKDETKYTGKMDEGTRNTVRKASQAAMILGGVGIGAGRSAGTDVVGGVLGTAGTVGTVMTNDRDYESTVEFSCR